MNIITFLYVKMMFSTFLGEEMGLTFMLIMFKSLFFLKNKDMTDPSHLQYQLGH